MHGCHLHVHIIHHTERFDAVCVASPFGPKPRRSECLKETSGQHRTAYNRAMLRDGGHGKTLLTLTALWAQDVRAERKDKAGTEVARKLDEATSRLREAEASHGLQLQSLWIIPTATVSSCGGGLCRRAGRAARRSVVAHSCSPYGEPLLQL